MKLRPFLAPHEQAPDDVGGAPKPAPAPRVEIEPSETKAGEKKARPGRPRDPSKPRDASGKIIRDHAAERARRSGSRASAPAEAKRQGPALTKERLGEYLEAGHAIGARYLRMPALQLATEEARDLAGATLDVLAQYRIELSPKVVAILNLLGVSCAIYLPRAIVIMAVNDLKRAEPSPEEKAGGAVQAGESTPAPRVPVAGGKIDLTGMA